MSDKVEYVPTGERRPPMAGEWFMGYRGPIQADFDFEWQHFDILRCVITKEADDANV